MIYINNITEPKQLWLMWQDNTPNRIRHKVGVLKQDMFEYVSEEELKSAKESGFMGYPAFSLSKKQHTNAIATFMSRCPPKNRRDYKVYLQSFGLNPDSDKVQNMSDFTLLSYTGAFLHSNPFMLLNDYADEYGCFDFIIQISRINEVYYSNHIYCATEIKQHLLDKKIYFKPENHPQDPMAVKVLVDGEGVGYIQTGLTQSFRKWIDQDRIIESKITKLNGEATHPNVYAYVKINKV